MLNNLFHALCYTVVCILALTTGNPVYLISTKGARWVWPVSRGCLFLLGTWSYLRIFRVRVAPTLDFVFTFWIMITFDTLLTSLFYNFYWPWGLSPSVSVGSNPIWTNLNMWESLSVDLLRVGVLCWITLHNVSAFSLLLYIRRTVFVIMYLEPF
jgi:hypothetical protein